MLEWKMAASSAAALPPSLSAGGGEVHILLVEDNPGDVRLVRESLRESGLPHRLTVATDGVEALERLRGAERPDVILLDLNLPRKDGREVLAEVKADSGLRSIPVVVLSSSDAQDDVAAAYALHANCYVTKPVDLDQFLEVVATIQRFWMGVAKLPS
jgi:two-component system, chemotaxis family, response regulator Rcp1